MKLKTWYTTTFTHSFQDFMKMETLYPSIGIPSRDTNTPFFTTVKKSSFTGLTQISITTGILLRNEPKSEIGL